MAELVLKMSNHDLVAGWAAFLSSLLGLIKVWEFWRNTPRLQITASIAFATDSAYGTEVTTEHGEQYAYIEITMVNGGEKPIQVFRTVVEGKTFSQQIETLNLSAVLQPGCRLTTRLQKEWLDHPDSSSLGVMSGTGKLVLLSKKKFTRILEGSRSLPSERKQYIKRDDPDAAPLWAFESHDPFVLINHKR